MDGISRMNILADKKEVNSMTLEEFYRYAEKHEGRWEFVDGIPLALASPSSHHQAIVGEIGRVFGNFFKGTNCTYRPSMDVKLFEDKTDIRIPDLLVYCDPAKDDGQRYNGAPTIVVEVWSRSNPSWERDRKRSDYERAGVSEIWEVFPEKNTVKVFFKRPDGLYEEDIYIFAEVLRSRLFPDLSVELAEFRR